MPAISKKDLIRSTDVFRASVHMRPGGDWTVGRLARTEGWGLRKTREVLQLMLDKGQVSLDNSVGAHRIYRWIPTAYDLAVRADNAFQVELVRVYGDKAADHRYWAATFTDEALIAAFTAKCVADEANRKSRIG